MGRPGAYARDLEARPECGRQGAHTAHPSGFERTPRRCEARGAGKIRKPVKTFLKGIATHCRTTWSGKTSRYHGFSKLEPSHASRPLADQIPDHPVFAPP